MSDSSMEGARLASSPVFSRTRTLFHCRPQVYFRLKPKPRRTDVFHVEESSSESSRIRICMSYVCGPTADNDPHQRREAGTRGLMCPPMNGKSASA
ncbi:hypothetical protein EVAR_41009_1 [Eumeta japonica]|uniref:Uncharacterized protein n=1 Tax=Eumeta variegata TaxID=151549 RepID=A0A4C1XDL6_EUMVA|nr:hypothetical protein EVAR_41009_1 [Eumeta japonica]